VAIPVGTRTADAGLTTITLAGLRWSDVDLKAGTLTVAQQRTSANYEEVISAPKASSYRQLLLAPATVAALREHRTRQRKERLLLGPAWTDSGYLFVDEVGVPYHPQKFTVLFAEAVAKSGVPKIRLHDTRHTMATLARSGSTSQDRARTARPLRDRRHARYVLARTPSSPTRRSRQDCRPVR
jgi:integrase